MNIGVDIGGTHIRIATGENGQINSKIDFPTGEFSDSVKQIKEEILKIASGQKASIGVAVPGPIETKTKILRASPNLPTWHDQPLKEILKEELSLPVELEHDASLAALAESKYGAGVGKNPLLYYTISTGIGTGLIYNGEIYRGVYNPEGGQQIVTGLNDTLENLASGTSITKLAGKAPTELIGSDIWDKALERIARGITNSIVQFAPEIVIIGGGLTSNKDAFFPPLVEKIREFLKIYPLPAIAVAGLGQDSTLIGAIEIASYL